MSGTGSAASRMQKGGGEDEAEDGGDDAPDAGPHAQRPVAAGHGDEAEDGSDRSEHDRNEEKRDDA